MEISYQFNPSEDGQTKLEEAFDILFTEVERRLKGRSATSGWLFVIPTDALTIVSNNVYT